jgi:excisionase family DNA binding protein
LLVFSANIDIKKCLLKFFSRREWRKKMRHIMELMQKTTDIGLTPEQAIRELLTAPVAKRSAMLAALESVRSNRPATLLLTPTEAARELRLSRQTIWRLTRQGALKSIIIGGSTRYRRIEIEQFATQGLDKITGGVQ